MQQMITPQNLIEMVDRCNQSTYDANKQLVNSLVDVKVALHKHDEILDDKTEEYKAKLVSDLLHNLLNR